LAERDCTACCLALNGICDGLNDLALCVAQCLARLLAFPRNDGPCEQSIAVSRTLGRAHSVMAGLFCGRDHDGD
jgi:hypothetical protein